MGVFGAWVVGTVIWARRQRNRTGTGHDGRGWLRGAGGQRGLFVLLYAYRDGDANMQSVWICSRNDVLGNLAVLLAALGVFGTGTGWPT